MLTAYGHQGRIEKPQRAAPLLQFPRNTKGAETDSVKHRKDKSETMTKLRLTGDHILLKQLPKPVRSPGGIALLTDYCDDKMQWEVLQVGHKVKLEVAVGDHVLVSGY